MERSEEELVTARKGSGVQTAKPPRKTGRKNDGSLATKPRGFVKGGEYRGRGSKVRARIKPRVGWNRRESRNIGHQSEDTEGRGSSVTIRTADNPCKRPAQSTPG